MKKVRWLILLLVMLVLVFFVVVGMMSVSDQSLLTEIEQVPRDQFIDWRYDGEQWSFNVPPPLCPVDLDIPLPVESKHISGILYPGQYRGNQFKPHGGFRFDNSLSGDITVTSPADGSVTIAASYLSSGSDDVQYMIDIVTPCGLMYRFDHLAQLSPKLQNALRFLPTPQVDDSRGHRLPQPLEVVEGEELATAVGFNSWEGRKNVFVDFGVYNLGQKNEASQRGDWPIDDHQWSELAPYGICWLDYLESRILASEIKQLPTGKEGRDSVYCL